METTCSIIECDKEAIDNLIANLNDKTIRPIRGLIQLDTGKYEEVLYKKSVYARETLITGVVRWRHTLYFGAGVSEGYSMTLRAARINSLKILKSKLERYGN